MMKRCSGPCGLTKDESEFYLKRRQRKDGTFQVTRQMYCKECSRAYQRSAKFRERQNARRRTPEFRIDRRITEIAKRLEAGQAPPAPRKTKEKYTRNSGRGAEPKIDASEFRKWLNTKDLQVVARNAGVARSRINGYAKKRSPEFEVVTLTFVDKVATANGSMFKLLYPDHE